MYSIFEKNIDLRKKGLEITVRRLTVLSYKAFKIIADT
jgi:hypothetical protein